MSLLELFRTAPPTVALTIDRRRVVAARLEWRGGKAVIAAHGTETLPDGAVVPALGLSNLADVGLVGQVVRRVLDSLGGRPARVALVLPDTVAKVSLVRLEKVPAKADDLRQIIGFQIRKGLPFPLDQTVLSISAGGVPAEGGHGFVVAASRADVVQQYEQACAIAGAHAGLVDLASFSVINGVLAGTAAPTGDWLLVHAADSYITLAVMRGQQLLFYRNRADEAEGTLADLIHQTAMYYEDRLRGTGFSRVLLAGSAALPGGSEVVRSELEQRLGVGVDVVDPRAAAALTQRIGAAPELLDTLAPLVGALRREGAAA